MTHETEHAPSLIVDSMKKLPVVSRIAMPLALFHLGGTIVNLTDTAMIGRLGPEALSAVALGNGILFTVFAVGMGAVMGADPLVAQSVGAGNHGRALGTLIAARVVAWRALFPSIVALVLAMAALFLTSIDDTVVVTAFGYVAGRIFGLPFEYLYVAERAYLQGYGKTRAITVAVVVSSVLNVPLDVVLIFGGDAFQAVGLTSLANVPALGAVGAGIATSIVVVIQYIFVRRANDILVVDVTAPPVVVDPKLVAKIGLPIGLQYALEIGIFSLVSVVMGTISTVVLAGHQIALTLASTTFRLALGISGGASVVVGHEIGRKDRRGTLAAGIAGIALGTAIMGTSGTVFRVIPETLARLFTDDPAIIAAATPLLFIAGVFQLSDGVQAVSGGLLRGAGDTQFAFVSNLVAYWFVALPCALWLTFVVELGAPGLWWGLTIGLTVAAIIQGGRFFYKAARGYEELS